MSAQVRAVEELPLGDKLTDVAPLDIPTQQDYAGEFVLLRPLDVERDIESLYAISHGDPEPEKLWTYMSGGPFADRDAMGTWLENLQEDSARLLFSVESKSLGQLVGMLAYQAIDPAMQRLELAHIWYCPEAQRTNVNTEAAYLLLKHVFDDNGYRRVEWKCDALNLKSRNAALRLGFSYEGTFKQHMVIKERNRDTAWFAMLDSDWPKLKDHMEKWLYSPEDCSLFALNQPQLRRAFF
ncbi:MAG: GNAT family protein [Cyanobacteria bacterium P01_A01_bin.3]